MISWEHVANVFDTLPEWADYYFWAPEINIDNGRVYVYYSAHKKDGNLCVGVASASRLEGPYQDHGPLVCQPVGSIDGFPWRDRDGKLYLIWKEDGNSVRQPTPIWCAQMNEERTALLGEKRELFRNTERWEGNLVEGVSIFEANGFLYALYAANACCGRECNYAVGVARARSIMGPWEKYDKNPLPTAANEWLCPGHGTPVMKDGAWYLLLHAYHRDGGVYVGRQGILTPLVFNKEGWIEVPLVKETILPTPREVIDSFDEESLSRQWQWSVFRQPRVQFINGCLELTASEENGGTFVAQKVFSSDYESELEIDLRKSSAETGIALIGDEKNMVAASVKNRVLTVWTLQNDEKKVIATKSLRRLKTTRLRLQVRQNKDVTFLLGDKNHYFTPLHDAVIDGQYLPPWDRALRVGIIASGPSSQKAVVHEFTLR